jgi:ubiquinone/menaquinone biosynthesis C-methylase UbiE
MGAVSPGNFDIIDEAIGMCGFPEGAKLLDAGCGEGCTLAYLERRIGAHGVGVDMSADMVARGRAKHPGLDLRAGVMELLEFPSFEFDGVIMECSLSLSPNKLEALHEAYCVLKRGGWLIVSDLYDKEPDPSAVAKARREAAAFRARPRREGDCGRDEAAPDEYCLGGAFVKEWLFEACHEAGFNRVAWIDKSEALAQFVAGKIFECGSLGAYWESLRAPGAEGGCFCAAAPRSGKLGYFLMTLRKP